MVISQQFINPIFIRTGKTAGASALIVNQGTGNNSTTERQCSHPNKVGILWVGGSEKERERETEGKWKEKGASWMQEWALQL